MPLHSDQVNLDMTVGAATRLAGQVGLLTDQNVIDATNTTDLKNSIDTNAQAAHADVRGYVPGLKKALDVGKDLGVYTDAAVQAATGVNNLASLTLSDPGKLGPNMLE